MGEARASYTSTVIDSTHRDRTGQEEGKAVRFSLAKAPEPLGPDTLHQVRRSCNDSPPESASRNQGWNRCLTEAHR